jgi:hypothetical protein
LSSRLWHPAAAWYLGLTLAGLAGGLWPGAIFHTRGQEAGPLPALQAMAVAQVAFFLLVYPVILARRAGGERSWASCAVESFLLLAATAPLYAAAAWVSDATWRDCLRAGLAAACACPLSWAAGRCLGARRWTSAVLICLLVAAAGLPWAQYVCRDFAALDRAADALWRASPVTFAWDAAASRQSSCWPHPAWPILVWLALAAAMAALAAVRKAPSKAAARPVPPQSA